MILTFPVRTLGGTAVPQTNDNPVILPPTLQPVVTFPGGMTVTNNVGLLASDSFAVSSEKQQIASQIAYSLQLCVFKAGIWHVWMAMKFISDYTLAPITATQPAIQLQDPQGNTAAFILNCGVVNGANVFLTAEFDFNFGRDGFTLSGEGPATGVGQTYDQTFQIVASRLA